MRITTCLFCLTLLTAQAVAQEGSDNPFNNEGGFAGQFGTAPRAPDKPEVLRIRITKRDCRRLAIETRSADVAYQPGVDVRGNAVESADLQSGFQYTLPDVIEFPIRINPITFQADRREADPDGVFAANDSTITVAQVRFDILSGKVTINGEPLVDSARQDVLDRCAAAGFLP